MIRRILITAFCAFAWQSGAFAMGGAPQQSAPPPPTTLPSPTPQSCTSADVRDARPALGRYFHVPLNQGDLGYCYAFATADLMAFRSGVQLSPGGIGYDYDTKYNQTPFGTKGGFVSNAVPMIRDQGACAASALPLDMPDVNKMADVVECAIHLHNGDFTTGSSIYNSIYSAYQGNPAWTCRQTIQTNFPWVSLQKFVAASEQLTATDQTSVTNWVISLVVNELSCPNGSRVSVPGDINVEWHQKGPESSVDLMSEIDSNLSAGNIIGINYDVTSFTKEGSTKADSSHASSILARRFNSTSGRCEYMIRNSWGADCAEYSAQVTPNCNAAEGTFWVADLDLMNVLQSVNWLD